LAPTNLLVRSVLWQSTHHLWSLNSPQFLALQLFCIVLLLSSFVNNDSIRLLFINIKMGKWAEATYEKELAEKLRKLFDETQERLSKDKPGTQFTFEEFVLGLNINDKMIQKIFEYLVKETIQGLQMDVEAARTAPVNSHSAPSAPIRAFQASSASGRTPTLLLAVPLSSLQSGGTIPIFLPSSILSSVNSSTTDSNS